MAVPVLLLTLFAAHPSVGALAVCAPPARVLPTHDTLPWRLVSRRGSRAMFRLQTYLPMNRCACCTVSDTAAATAITVICIRLLFGRRAVVLIV
jgi:hypothetical protein